MVASFKRHIRQSLIDIISAGMTYTIICAGANIGVATYVGDKISVQQATSLIEKERENFYLKDKEINYVLLEGRELYSRGIKAASYSSENKFYIIQEKNKAYGKPLLHEIGHIILNSPTKENVPLKRVLSNLKGENINKKSDTLRREFAEISYFLSPIELFCNIYAITKDLKYKNKNY